MSQGAGDGEGDARGIDEATGPGDAADARVLDRLHAAVLARKDADPATSYTAKLFARGRAKIAQKVGEESVEAVIEAMRDDRAALTAESADLLYHLTVLWADAGLDPADVWAELEARTGVSGLDEKARRTGGTPGPGAKNRGA